MKHRTTAFETLADPVRGLGASPPNCDGATGAYTLVFATLMFTSGALGDRFGHRTVLATGMVIFACASPWAAYAGDPGQLTAARAAMGVGSALIMPAQMAVLVWTFSGPARENAIGISLASAGVGIAAGPLLSGLLLDHFWWGSVFLINTPIVVLSLIGIAKARQDEERRKWDSAWKDTGKVFTKEDGSWLHPETVSETFRGILATTNLPRRSPSAICATSPRRSRMEAAATSTP